MRHKNGQKKFYTVLVYLLCLNQLSFGAATTVTFSCANVVEAAAGMGEALIAHGESFSSLATQFEDIDGAQAAELLAKVANAGEESTEGFESASRATLTSTDAAEEEDEEGPGGESKKKKSPPKKRTASRSLDGTVKVEEEKLQRAAFTLDKLWRAMYGSQFAWESLPPSDDPFFENGKNIRQIVTATGGRIPRPVVERWRENQALVSKEVKDLKEKIEAERDKLEGKDKKGAYLPLYFVNLLRTARSMLVEGRGLSSAPAYASPMSSLIRRNTDDFVTILEDYPLLDEDQAQLLLKLARLFLASPKISGILRQKLDRSSCGGDVAGSPNPIFSAIEDLMACTHGTTTQPMTIESRVTIKVLLEVMFKLGGMEYETVTKEDEDHWFAPKVGGGYTKVDGNNFRRALREWFKVHLETPFGEVMGEHKVTDMQKAYVAHSLARTFERVEAKEDDLTAREERFATDRITTTKMGPILERISRVHAGQPLVGTGNPLNDAWVTSLSDYPMLRAMCFATLAGDTTLRHPVYKETKDLGMSPAQAAEVFGHREIDPMLLGQFIRKSHMARVLKASYRSALRADLREARKAVQNARIEVGAPIIIQAANQAVDHLAAGYVTGEVTQGLWNALRDQIRLDQKEAEKADASEDTAPVGRICQLGAAFSTSLDSILPTLSQAISNSEKEGGSGEETEGDSSTVDWEAVKKEGLTPHDQLILILQRLNNRAQTLMEEERSALSAQSIPEFARDDKFTGNASQLNKYKGLVAEKRKELEPRFTKLSANKTRLVQALLSLIQHIQYSLMPADTTTLSERDNAQHEANAERTLIKYLNHAPHLRAFMMTENYHDLHPIQRRFIDLELYRRLFNSLDTRLSNRVDREILQSLKSKRLLKTLAWSVVTLVGLGVMTYTHDWWWPVVKKVIPSFMAPNSSAPEPTPPPQGDDAQAALGRNWVRH